MRGPTWSYPFLEGREEVSVSKSTLVSAPSGHGAGDAQSGSSEEEKYCLAPRLLRGEKAVGER